MKFTQVFRLGGHRAGASRFFRLGAFILALLLISAPVGLADDPVPCPECDYGFPGGYPDPPAAPRPPEPPEDWKTQCPCNRSMMLHSTS